MSEREAVRVWPHWNLRGVEQEHGPGNTDADGCSWCKCERPTDECAACVALAEVERLRAVVGRAQEVVASVSELGYSYREMPGMNFVNPKFVQRLVAAIAKVEAENG